MKRLDGARLGLKCILQNLVSQNVANRAQIGVQTKRKLESQEVHMWKC